MWLWLSLHGCILLTPSARDGVRLEGPRAWPCAKLSKPSAWGTVLAGLSAPCSRGSLKMLLLALCLQEALCTMGTLWDSCPLLDTPMPWLT